jgi:hypothetical protein
MNSWWGWSQKTEFTTDHMGQNFQQNHQSLQNSTMLDGWLTNAERLTND